MKGAGYRASQMGQCFSCLIKSVSLDSEPVKSYFIFYYLFTYFLIGKLQASIFTRSLEVRLGMENQEHAQCCSMGYGAGFLGPDAEDECQAGTLRDQSTGCLSPLPS